MRRVPIEELEAFGIRLLTDLGVPEVHARAASEIVVRTEAYGISTHGLKAFSYLDARLGDLLDPRAEPVLVRERAATAMLDGNRCMGQTAVLRAIEIGMAKARKAGVAMVGVRNTGWIGALGPYLIPVVEQGMLAQLWGQTNTCKDCAPVGGIDATFSTNPVALAFPTGAIPVIGDISSASVAMGQVMTMMREGRTAAENIFMDRDGNLTDDPAVVQDGGSILFLGGEHFGHKGYCLSLWCEAISALAGGDCNNPAKMQRQVVNLTVVDPEAFAGGDYLATEMQRFIAHVKASRLRPGVEAIRLPGERGLKALAASKADGMPLAPHLAEMLNEIAERRGIDTRF